MLAIVYFKIKRNVHRVLNRRIRPRLNCSRRACFSGAIAAILGIAGFGSGSAAASLLAVGRSVQSSYFWRWTSETWKHDDNSYESVRRTIDRAMQHHVKPAALLRAYRVAAIAHHRRPEYLFGWMYSSYVLADAGNAEGRSDLQKINYEIPFTPSPKSYQYTRLHFLLQALQEPSAELRSLGLHLHDVDPNDYDVTYQLVRVLNQSGTIDDRTQALKFSRQLTKMRPDKAKGYALLGGVYFRAFLISRDEKDRIEAKENYKLFILLAPPGDHFIARAKNLIGFLDRPIGFTGKR